MERIDVTLQRYYFPQRRRTGKHIICDFSLLWESHTSSDILNTDAGWVAVSYNWVDWMDDWYPGGVRL